MKSWKGILRDLSCLPWRIVNTYQFRLKKVSLGREHYLLGRIQVVNRGVIQIGERSLISGAKSSIGFSDSCCFTTESAGRISIGDEFAMSNSAIYCRKAVTIGNHVMIGGGCKIYDTDFHSLDIRYRGKSEDKAHAVSKSVIIEDDVFIGAGSFILKGVHIGAGAVIGAGSVVTKDVPAGQIWAGNPARFIRKI